MRRQVSLRRGVSFLFRVRPSVGSCVFRTYVVLACFFFFRSAAVARHVRVAALEQLLFLQYCGRVSVNAPQHRAETKSFFQDSVGMCGAHITGIHPNDENASRLPYKNRDTATHPHQPPHQHHHYPIATRVRVQCMYLSGAHVRLQ